MSDSKERNIIPVLNNYQHNTGFMLTGCGKCKKNFVEVFSETEIPAYSFCPHCGVSLIQSIAEPPPLTAYKMRIPWNDNYEKRESETGAGIWFRNTPVSRAEIHILVRRKAVILGYDDGFGENTNVNTEDVKFLLLEPLGYFTHIFSISAEIDDEDYFDECSADLIEWQDFLKLPEALNE